MMRLSYVKGLALLLALAASPALAEPDSFHLGQGRDGVFTTTSSGHVVNTYAPVTVGLLPGDQKIQIGTLRPATVTGTVPALTAFNVNDLVMVLQTTGIVPPAQSGIDAPIDLNSDAVGHWELARLASVTGSTLALTAPLMYSYAAGVTQVIRVPEFTSVSIDGTSESIVAAPWQWDASTSSGTGGVVAFLSQGTINIVSGGSISASEKGFHGGLYVRSQGLGSLSSGCSDLDQESANGGRKGEGVDPTKYNISTDASSDWGAGLGNVANGGGGGVCAQSGGGGGGNAGNGGKGGKSSDNGLDPGGRDVGGMGGSQLVYSMLEHLTLGGGGGSGHGYANATQSSGGKGGGIVFVRGASLTGSGRIEASGANGLASSGDGAGGGGSGGTILVRLSGSMSCDDILARGGSGGGTADDRGPGGGGGGGRILYQTTSKGAGCDFDVNAGQAGSISSGGHNGATPASADVSRAPFVGLISVLPGALTNPASETVSLSKPASSSVSSPTMDKTGILVVTGQTVQPDRQVVVYLNGVEFSRTSSSSSGDFTLTLASKLPDGFYKVEAAVAFPAQGTQGPKSPARYIQFDSVKPAPPALTEFASAGVASGRSIKEQKPGVKGTAEPGSTITVTIEQLTGGSRVVIADAASKAAADGTWTWTWPTSPPASAAQLDPANYKLTAKATDAAGNVSDASYELRFTVDITTAAPVLKQIAGKPVSGTIRVNSTRPSLLGTAEPGSTITLNVNSASLSVNVDGTAVTDSSGVWSWAWPEAAAALRATNTGDLYTITASAEDLAENATPMSPVNFYVDTGTPTPVVSTLATQSVTNGMRISSTQPAVAGAASTGAEPGSTISIYIDGTKRGTTTANLDGSWTWSFNGTALTEAIHSLKVSAEDTTGNISPVSDALSFYVDQTAPVLQVLRLGTLEASDGMSISAQQPNVEGMAEPGSRIILRITQSGSAKVPDRTLNANNNGVWSWTWEDPAAQLGPGSYSLELQATDLAGLTSSKALAFTVDISVSPGITVERVGNKLLSGASSVSINTGRPMVLGSVEKDSVVTVDFLQGGTSKLKMTTKADASGAWSVAPPESFTGLADGSYQVSVSAQDKLKNSATAAALTVLVDSVRPDTTIRTGPPVIGAPGNVTFTFECSDADSGCLATALPYQCSFEGGPFLDCASPFEKKDLANGEYFLLVRAVDQAGNVDDSPASYYWKVSGGAFSVDVASQPASPTKNNTAIIELQPNRSGTITYRCSLQTPSMASPPPLGSCLGVSEPDEDNLTRLTLTTDSQGVYALQIKATEDATDESVTRFVTWIYDSIAPSKPVISEPAPSVKFINTASPTLRGSVPDLPGSDRPGEKLYVNIQIGTESKEVAVDPSTKLWSYKTPLLADGPYTVSVTARDDTPNENETPAIARFTIDTLPPRITEITGQPALLTNVPKIDVQFKANETSTFSCVRDQNPLDGNFKPCNTDGSGSYAEEGLSDGPHVLYVRATDEAQNVGNYAQVNWTLDTLPPETYIKKAPEQRTNSPDAVFEFESEPGASFECALDNGGASFTKCSLVSFSGLSEGAHELRVRAVDQAGNPDLSPTIFPWTVDITAPVPPVILSPASRGVLSTVLSTVSGTGEPGSTVVIYLQDLEVGSATVKPDGRWDASLTLSISDGEYTLNATSTDVANNTSPSSDGHLVRVDVTAPDTQISEGPQGRVDQTNATFVFQALGESAPTTFQCSLDQGEFVACTSPLSFDGLADGTHVLKVAAVDEALNPDQSPASWSWTVDLINDTRAIGGGLSCASTQATETSFVAWLGLAGLFSLLARRRRS